MIDFLFKKLKIFSNFPKLRLLDPLMTWSKSDDIEIEKILNEFGYPRFSRLDLLMYMLTYLHEETNI